MICSTRGGDLEAEGDSKIGRDSDVIGRGCSMAVQNRVWWQYSSSASSQVITRHICNDEGQGQARKTSHGQGSDQQDIWPDKLQCSPGKDNDEES